MSRDRPIGVLQLFLSEDRPSVLYRSFVFYS